MNKILLAGVAALALTVSTNAFAQVTGNNDNKALSGAAAIVDAREMNRSNVDNDPPAIAPNLGGLVATPTTCMGSTQGTAGGGGIFSVGFGTTWKDGECEKREALKLAAQLGLKEAAAALFYNLDAVQGVMEAPGATRAISEAEDVANYNIRADVAPAAAPGAGEDRMRVSLRDDTVGQGGQELTAREQRADRNGDGIVTIGELNDMRDR